MGALKSAKGGARPAPAARAEKRARVRRGWTAEEDSRIWQVVHARSGAAGGANRETLLRSHGRRAAPPVRAYASASPPSARRRRRRRRRQRRRRRRCRRCWAGVACGRRQRRQRLRRRWQILGCNGTASPNASRVGACAVRHHYNRLQRGTSRVVSRSKGAERTPGEGQGQGQVQSPEHEREGESEAE